MPKIKEVKSKAKRRGNNEGSIYQRKDKRWCGAVTVGYKTDGKPIRRTIYGTSRQEVAKQITALTDEVFTNGYISVSAKNERNFEVLCREWYDLFVAPTISSVTEEKHRNMLKNHFFKAFGALDVQSVDLVRLQRFFNEKVKAGLSADFINKMKSLLNKFLVYAVKKHYITANPLADVIIKKNNSDNAEKEKALRQEIRQSVLNRVAEDKLLKPIVITFSFTGLRPQELIALKWENVNLKEKTISVKQALNRVITFDERGNVTARGQTIGKTKSPKSVRTFVMPDVVVAVLEEWQVYCEDRNIKSEFVFPNTKTGAMRTYSGLRSLLVRFVQKHKLEDEHISLYTFRHTFATVLLEERENPRIVADLMGHQKVSTTLDIYSHVMSNSVYQQTAQTLDNVFSRYA
ncbi:MAG: site-specific integrase [Oscillospiraceae bacterium]|nr:site-specific integrase [Oscillospiraceae bacterium]